MTTILFQKMQSDDSSARSPDVEENSSYPTGRFASLVVMMMIDDGDDHLSDFLIRASVQDKIGVHQLLPLLLPTFQSRSWDFLNQNLKKKTLKNFYKFLLQRPKVYKYISKQNSCLWFLLPMREVAAALLF